MDSADGRETDFSLNSSLIEPLVRRSERAQAPLYWFHESDDEDTATEEWSFAAPEARTQALEARLLARASEDERVLLPCHGLAEATAHGWDDAAAVPDADVLTSRFRAQAERTPDAVAVVGLDERLTYAELDARSDALAWHLREHGVGPDVRVGVGVERATGWVVALLGVLKAGGACVPLAAEASSEARAAVLSDARARVLVTQSGREAAGGVTTLYVDTAEAFELGVLGPPHVGTSPDAVASVLYTADASGQPRGEALTHARVAELFAMLDTRVGPVPPATWLAMARDGSPLEVLWALLRGLCVVMR